VVTTTSNRNLSRLILTAAGQQETVPVGALVGAALVSFSDSYTRTRIRELRARGLLEQEGTGGPYRLTTAGREALAELDRRQESEAAA
jgi:Mn-dependent DtxR family transcriptional regulator